MINGVKGSTCFFFVVFFAFLLIPKQTAKTELKKMAKKKNIAEKIDGLKEE